MERFKLGVAALAIIIVIAAGIWGGLSILEFLLINWRIGKWVFGISATILVIYLVGWAIEITSS